MKIPEELYNYIISGKCVLFIGAGASMEAGAPSAQELAKDLSKNYLEGQHQKEPLSRVASYVQSKPGLGRRVVIDYVVNRFSQLEPNKAHLLLPRFNWPAIYTTNYDTLIEQAYEKSGIKYKTVISSFDLTSDTNNKTNYILIYKPHGCISRSLSKETPIVITEDDYYSAIDNRRIIYRQLEVHKYISVFLFVGYSFSDFNLSKIWFDVSNELGKFSQWAYALWPNCSEIQKLTWRDRKVELINMQFNEFMEELSSIYYEKQKEQEFSISNVNLLEIVKMLIFMIGAKDPFIKRHSLRVQKLSLMIAKEMGTQPNEYQLLEIAALLHDIGFVLIPDNVIRKPGKLFQSEWEILKRHPVIGEQLLSSYTDLISISKIVRCHHERFNGMGYPDGLVGENIPQNARIIAVADSLDAMMCNRPYRVSLELEEAVTEIDKGSGEQFDPMVVSILKRLYKHGELKELW